jgi:NADPH:quinone reductase
MVFKSKDISSCSLTKWAVEEYFIMKAACYEKTGPANEVLKLDNVPTPVPSTGEVRVRLQWSGVNPSDVKARAGLRSKILPFPLIIPHSDGAGIVDQIGDGVPVERIGEPVWLWNAGWKRPFGTAAEYVVLPAPQAVPLPLETELDVGACLGIPALTAYHAVQVDGGVADKSVLVAGGAGRVGHYAIQLARLKGAAQILTTVSCTEKAAIAKRSGADVTINYKSEDVVARVLEATNGHGVDRIIEVDLAGNIGTDLQLLRPEGDIVVYGSNSEQIPVPFFSMVAKNTRLRFFIVYNLSVPARESAIKDLTGLLKNGSLIHNIAIRLPLERIADAHTFIENGHVGNVILSVE